MFQLSLFTEFGRLCNPFDYVLGFTFLLMAFHLLFLLFNLRERQRVKLFCLGSASLVLLLHIAALRLSFQFTNLTFDTVATGPAPGLLGALGSRTWLYPFFLYLLLLPLACVPPRQDSCPDNSSFRKEVTHDRCPILQCGQPADGLYRLGAGGVVLSPS